MDASVWNTDEKGKPCSCAMSTGMVEHHFYRFDAFYTFNPDLIARVGRDIEEILAGRASWMREFERLLAIDRTAKQLDAEFARGHKVVEGALRKLQIADNRYEARRFAADLEKSLQRLKLLTGQLPNLVSAAHSRLAA